MAKKEIKRPEHLCICGKTIDISKITEKSKAQFAAQLKTNGIVLPEAHLAQLYETLTAEPAQEEQHNS